MFQPRVLITGATGLVGMAVAKHFSSLGIDVLCLGRQILSPEDISRHFGLGSSYLKLAMEDMASLEELDLLEAMVLLVLELVRCPTSPCQSLCRVRTGG